jgi:hypothetical protein
MEKILLLEISELKNLELTCPNPECGKRYIFDPYHSKKIQTLETVHFKGKTP